MCLNFYELYQIRDFNKVAHWIIGTSKLTKDQALAVWQGYCNKRVVGGNKAWEARIINSYKKA